MAALFQKLAALPFLLVPGFLHAQTSSEFSRLYPGAESGVRQISWRASGENFDPGQTVVAGVGARHTSSYTVEADWQPGGDLSYQWHVEIHYPFPTTWEYKETFGAAGTGSIEGADGFRPSPAGELPPARVAARLKFHWLASPLSLLLHAEDVSEIRGKPDTFRFTAIDSAWNIRLDPATGLPVRLWTAESDPIFGTVETSVGYSAWQAVEGAMIPAALEFRVDGDLVRRERRTAIDVTPGEFVRSPDYRSVRDDPMFDRGWNMSHWFTRRISLGGPMDRDQSLPVEFQEVGSGLYQVLGTSHHNFVIEVENGLVVVDAPLYPSRQQAVLGALNERWPGKPVQHLILTHHHFDHSGGLATYAAAGIPITMHSLNRELFVGAFERLGFGVVDIRTVGSQARLEIGGRSIHLYEIPTVHAKGMYGVYLPDEKIMLIVDIYSPRQQYRNELWASEALSAVRFLDIPIERVVGAHGSGTHSVTEMEAALGQ